MIKRILTWLSLGPNRVSLVHPIQRASSAVVGWSACRRFSVRVASARKYSVSRSRTPGGDQYQSIKTDSLLAKAKNTYLMMARWAFNRRAAS